MFEYEVFKPNPPTSTDGVMEYILLTIDSRPNYCYDQGLKHKWTKLGGNYTVSMKHFEQSGQGNSQFFQILRTEIINSAIYL